MDKKNTLLLTVIAIATLLVAVVGATFAYFSAQVGTSKQADIKVTTNTTDTATMKINGDININANQTNFANEEGSLMDTVSAYVKFEPTNMAEGGTRKYCYTTTISVTQNNFEYSIAKQLFNGSEHYPELVLNVWKESGASDDSLESVSGTEYKKAILLGDAEKKLEYKTPILSSTKVCDLTKDSPNCQETQAVNGYDITVIKNSNFESTIKDVSDIKIPKDPNGDYSTYQENDYIHEISANGGEGATAKYDKWKVAVTFVNYSDDDIEGQPGDADQNKNASTESVSKLFKAELIFKTVACPGV